ncbi:hypothetical protein OHA40_01710 [Nocardia sp. NBC_00508]|uniref:hypothetical protein n=1 Tax=Nocardia sp. NBC_00508 TaxID=2975992 RepID=UPI002E80FEFA|nr:hypothetical protein [Nocardia sp. NBC_00508]WUD66913.1 hypothetical protein OHA40_01710 [Nocardia sp. NBC_00508]
MPDAAVGVRVADAGVLVRVLVADVAVQVLVADVGVLVRVLVADVGVRARVLVADVAVRALVPGVGARARAPDALAVTDLVRVPLVRPSATALRAPVPLSGRQRRGRRCCLRVG